MSLCRENFAKESEDALNNHITLELFASQTYLSMYAFFSRDTVALHGIANYFKKESEEESEHAKKFIEYVIKRGGRVALQKIEAPQTEWENATKAFEASLALEKKVLQSILALHALSGEHNDPSMSDYLEDWIQEQHEALKKVSDYVTNLKRVGEGLGVYLFDKNLQ